MKYHNQPTTLDGIRFDSKKEAARYGELKLLEKCGAVKDLQVHPVWRLNVNGQCVGKYEADFSYQERNEITPMMFAFIVEDVKGMKTPVYRLKKKLMRALFEIEIRET